VRRDEPDAVFLPGTLDARIAVVGAVADHSFWFCAFTAGARAGSACGRNLIPNLP
jgi:hypothetical protein